MDREKVVRCLTDIEQIMITRQEICPREELQYWIELQEGVADALAMLKNDYEQNRRKLQHIADSQLAIGGADPLTDYEQGQWDGLQLAWEILMEDHSEASYYCEVKTNEQKNGLADHDRKTSEEGNSGTQG